MSTPHKLGVRNPSSQASASSDCAADAGTISDPRVQGFLAAVSLMTGIPENELLVSISGGGDGPHRPKVLDTTEAPAGTTPAGVARG